MILYNYYLLLKDGVTMKIRINKKHLFQGVFFSHKMVDLKNDNLKVEFFYKDNLFMLKNYDTRLITSFTTYQSFRKQLSLDIVNW